MKEKTQIETLIGEIDKTLAMIGKIDGFYRDFLENDLALLGRKKTSAVVIAEVLTDFYTCIETLFLRISQFFENALQKDKWHTDLLYKMTIDIRDVRKAVISDETFSILRELLKFRHFKRYYFEFDYDWDKIAFLEKKYNQVKPLIERDLDAFTAFLNKLKTSV